MGRMTCSSVFGLVVAGALATALCGRVRADTINLVTNGGFETGNFSGWTQAGDTEFTFVSTTPSAVHSGTYGASLGPFGSDGFLSQTVATTIGDDYTFNFYFAANGGPTNDFKATFAGDTVLNLTNFPANNVSGQFQQYTGTVVATASSSLLQFEFRQDPNFDGLDDVSVTDVGPTGAATPLPASVWGGSALLGLLGLPVLKRRRRLHPVA